MNIDIKIFNKILADIKRILSLFIIVKHNVSKINHQNEGQKLFDHHDSLKMPLIKIKHSTVDNIYT